MAKQILEIPLSLGSPNVIQFQEIQAESPELNTGG